MTDLTNSQRLIAAIRKVEADAPETLTSDDRGAVERLIWEIAHAEPGTEVLDMIEQQEFAKAADVVGISADAGSKVLVRLLRKLHGQSPQHLQAVADGRA